ncbi:uncharacterized protein C8R27_12541 [Nitrosomonas ureae]|uniref:Mth938-like domain-containing protein n=1 Tax=Nitrosomonas ureae TaxID=44577 RepID=UPI000D751226|nr:Mth938-like domain-containing protein [Nitrosomonas ureae]PXX12387.1 uncharacterized protein C8R27_12541 [Nitrosomonas ureae]
MKLHPAHFSHQYIFTGYGDKYVEVNQIRYEKNLIVLPNRLIENWPVISVSELEIQHFENLLPHAPEIVVLGTGISHQFPHYSLLNQMAKMGIGIEIMDTKACCRTYNILVEEGRHVAAALFI